MAAAAYLIAHPAIERARARIAFTVDEEVGRGTDHFDLERVRRRPRLHARRVVVGRDRERDVLRGRAEGHLPRRWRPPGTAKGKLVNPVKLAAQFIASLPRETLSPETTEGREGFVHPYAIEGGAEAVTVTLIVRDHDAALLDEHEALVRRLADEALQRPARERHIQRWEQYRNMREALDRVPHVVDAALEATRRVGLEPKLESIRGGTDGARLTERGLPTPNVFAGGNDFHSRARVDQRRGSGDLRRHHRRAAEGLGRAGPQALVRAGRRG